MSSDPEVSEATGVDERDDRVSKWRRMTTPSLGKVFDPRCNALNAWRLVLASGVILWHSWPLTGRHISFAPVHQLLSDVWVDGFFAISGFLITRSWFSRPRAREYFVARALRILPGLWVCLIVTAFVIAPIAVAIQGGSPAKLLLSRAPFEYVFGNSAVALTKSDIGGTPSGIPWSGGWNGSLWTLQYELLCYIAVAVLGVTGLLRRQWVIPTLFVLAVYWSVMQPTISGLAEQPPTPGRQIDPAVVMAAMEAAAARCALMFLAGALVYQFRNLLPARWSLVALSVIIVLAASLLPNYRLVAAIPLAYAVIVSGALIRNNRLNLRTDLSYGVYIYAFPIQQLLIICGLGVLNPYLLAITAAIAVLPLAALSWFLVEKPALSLKTRWARASR